MGVLGPDPYGGLLFDADVLIDYCKADRSIIPLIRAHVGPVFVLTNVLGEVDQLHGQDLAALGITPIEPETASLNRAVSWNIPALSLQDRLCLLVAEEYGYAYVTNDGKLRRECARRGVPVRWGLELLAILVGLGAVPAAQAAEWGKTIHRTNPRITGAVLAGFLQKLGLGT